MIDKIALRLIEKDGWEYQGDDILNSKNPRARIYVEVARCIYAEFVSPRETILSDINQIMWNSYMIADYDFSRDTGKKIMNELNTWTSLEI